MRNMRNMICKYFSLSVCCLFALMIMLLDTQKFYILMCQIYLFFVLLLVLLVSYLRIHCQIQGCEDLPLCFLQRVYGFSSYT